MQQRQTPLKRWAVALYDQYKILENLSSEEAQKESALWNSFKSERDDNKKAEILKQINESRLKQGKPVWDLWKPKEQGQGGKRFFPKPRTVEEKLTDLSAFYNYLAEKGLLEKIEDNQLGILLCSVFNGK